MSHLDHIPAWGFVGGGGVVSLGLFAIDETSGLLAGAPPWVHFIVWGASILAALAGAVLAIRRMISASDIKTAEVVGSVNANVEKAIGDRQTVQEEAIASLLREQRQTNMKLDLRHDLGDRIEKLIGDIGSMREQEKLHYEKLTQDFNGLGKRITERMDKVELTVAKMDARLTLVEAKQK